jgi:hypothetical protein
MAFGTGPTKLPGDSKNLAGNQTTASAYVLPDCPVAAAGRRRCSPPHVGADGVLLSSELPDASLSPLYASYRQRCRVGGGTLCNGESGCSRLDAEMGAGGHWHIARLLASGALNPCGRSVGNVAQSQWEAPSIAAGYSSFSQ